MKRRVDSLYIPIHTSVVISLSVISERIWPELVNFAKNSDNVKLMFKFS